MNFNLNLMEVFMVDTIEKRLKDFKGYQILKVIDNKGLCSEKTTYIAYKDDELVDAKKSLAELKIVLGG